MTEWPEALVERVARAIFDSDDSRGWNFEQIRHRYIKNALAALDASGLREAIETLTVFAKVADDYGADEWAGSRTSVSLGECRVARAALTLIKGAP